VNDTPIEAPKKKRSFLSIPFLIIGALLVACLLPILNDFDNDEKRDSISKYLMFKVMSSQERAKEHAEDGMYKLPPELEAKRKKIPKQENTKGPDFSKGETGGFGPPPSSNKAKTKKADEGSDTKSEEETTEKNE